MLLILLAIGGYGTLGSDGVPDDDSKDWWQTAEDYEEELWHNI